MSASTPFGFDDALLRHPEARHMLLLNSHRAVDEEHGLHPSRLSVRWPDLKTFVVPRPDFKGLDDVCPLLVEIAFPNQVSAYPSDLLEEAWTLALQDHASPNGMYVCGLLSVYGELPAVAEQLARSMPVTQSRTGKQWLAYFEPLRLQLLTAMLAADDLVGLLGPVVQWRYVDIAGRLRLIENNTIQSVAEGKRSRAVALTDDAHHWQAQVPVLSRIAWAWNESSAPLPDDALHCMCKALQRTLQAGLTADEDLIACAVTLLEHGDDWFSSPDTQCLLARIAQGKTTFLDAYAEA